MNKATFFQSLFGGVISFMLLGTSLQALPGAGAESPLTDQGGAIANSNFLNYNRDVNIQRFYDIAMRNPDAQIEVSQNDSSGYGLHAVDSNTNPHITSLTSEETAKRKETLKVFAQSLQQKFGPEIATWAFKKAAIDTTSDAPINGEKIMQVLLHANNQFIENATDALPEITTAENQNRDSVKTLDTNTQIAANKELIRQNKLLIRKLKLNEELKKEGLTPKTAETVQDAILVLELLTEMERTDLPGLNAAHRTEYLSPLSEISLLKIALVKESEKKENQDTYAVLLKLQSRYKTVEAFQSYLKDKADTHPRIKKAILLNQAILHIESAMNNYAEAHQATLEAKSYRALQASQEAETAMTKCYRLLAQNPELAELANSDLENFQ